MEYSWLLEQVKDEICFVKDDKVGTKTSSMIPSSIIFQQFEQGGIITTYSFCPHSTPFFSYKIAWHAEYIVVSHQLLALHKHRHIYKHNSMNAFGDVGSMHPYRDNVQIHHWSGRASSWTIYRGRGPPVGTESKLKYMKCFWHITSLYSLSLSLAHCYYSPHLVVVLIGIRSSSSTIFNFKDETYCPKYVNAHSYWH